jgi:phosphatidylserine/phosphatidylglycerophosphate/cardiolipin synthase-like enzyme
MNERIIRFFERVLFTIVFVAIVAVFWLAVRQLEYGRSPIAYAQKTLFSPKSVTVDPSYQVKKALFSPDDDIATALIGLIEGETEAIKAAIYLLTHREIAQALIDARERGVNVELVVDPNSVDSRFSKGSLLARHGIPIYVYKPYTSTAKSSGEQSSLMHNKFFVFKNTVGNRKVLVTGSFNATRSASTLNQENMLFIDDPALADAYLTQFEKLKQRSRRY